ncbi:MAG: MATE family efflux transporter [Lachnospiraceae bacterium]|nr:MATE family efflux transporter [Candidatus Merdinaster equi]
MNNEAEVKDNNKPYENPLGTRSIWALIRKFAIPSIIAMLVGSLYNIVDQFFIGQKVGELGNAATNIAFPLSTLCTSIGLLFGIGGASAFNISLGKKEEKLAAKYMGNAISMLVICGVVLMLATRFALGDMLAFFGAGDAILPLAMDYTGITSFGFPLLILGIGGCHLVRADGRPMMTMAINLTGAIVNTILDYLFVFVFDYGICGAAVATVIGQAIQGGMALICLARCRSIKLKFTDIIPKWSAIWKDISLGFANCFNMIAMMIVQIIMNKSLAYYGGLSNYGEVIPIAVSGIVAKVNMVFMSFVIGLSQGMQPIASFNCGAQNYARVKEALLKTLRVGAIIALVAMAAFQIFPRQIISIFGDGTETETYYIFAENYFHFFLMLTIVNFIQPISSSFFTSIARPGKGAFLSLTRQIIFLLPLIFILPLFVGIDGIMYAGPIADGLAAAVSILMVLIELKRERYR